MVGAAAQVWFHGVSHDDATRPQRVVMNNDQIMGAK